MMNFLKKWLCLVLLGGLLGTTVVYGQGIVVNNAAYDQLPMVSFNDGKGGKSSEIKHSPLVTLKQYVPNVIQQKGVACGPAAFCYYGLTMEYAVKLDLDSRQLNQLAFSYMYVYNQIEKEKQRECGNTSPEAICNFLISKGDVFSSQFDMKPCGVQPNQALMAKAMQYRIKKHSKVFERMAERDKKLEQMQSNLLSGRPVVIVLDQFHGFKQQGDFFKYVKRPENSEAHAMVVIGYDNYKEAFEVVNSHGKDWGKGGFSYIKYDDFIKHCSWAYTLHVDIRMEENGENALTAKALHYQGSFELQKMFRFKAPKVLAAQKTGAYTYKPTDKDWQYGNIFQLSLKKAKEGQAVYVFSIDKKGANIHWPRSLSASDADTSFHNTKFVGAGEVPYVPYEACELVIPGNGNVLFRQATEDHVIVLFTHKEINNFAQRVLKVNRGIGSIEQRFEHGFGDLIIPHKEINYKSDKIAFTASTDNEEGVIPIILTIDGQ